MTTQPFPGLSDRYASAVHGCDGGRKTAHPPPSSLKIFLKTDLMHVPENSFGLGRGYHHSRGNTALVRGKDKLIGAPLMATDLRASASLILGGLFAEAAGDDGKSYLSPRSRLRTNGSRNFEIWEHPLSESSNCIFCKIVAGEIPSPRIYEDEKT